MNKTSNKKFLGITTLGKKGQIVIPAEARTAMKLAEGEKLIVMGAHENALVLMKASHFETMAAHFTGTYFEYISTRDRSQHPRGQGIRTKTYPMRYGEDEMTQASRMLALSRRVAAASSRGRVAPRSRSARLLSPRRASPQGKASRNAGRRYIRNRFRHLDSVRKLIKKGRQS